MQKTYPWKLVGILVTSIFLVGVSIPHTWADTPNLKKKQVVLGGLFSLSGSWSTLGRVAIETGCLL